MRLTVSALALAFMAQGALVQGVFAQDSGAVVIGDVGNRITLSRAQLYRAIGDRVVTGSDVIGNNKLNWQQVDPSLPRSAIEITMSGAGDDAALLDTIRQGCLDAGGSYASCAKVRLRQDRLDRDGYRWDSALLVQGLARFDATPAAREGALFLAPPPPPPAPAPAPAPYVAPPTYITTTIIDASAGQRTTAIPAMTAPVIERPVVEAAAAQPVYATRLFLGRDSFPPEAFAAYGILAFRTLSTSEDEAQYIAICEAFFSALMNPGDVPGELGDQMVTVWPIDDRGQPELADSLNTTRAQEDSCENAVEFYDIAIARGAIGEAMSTGMTLSGRGPFLLAWSPAETKGMPDAVVLAADLSDVKTVADAKDVLRIWREDIEGDPALWQGGFSVEKTRVKLRQIVNRYGDGLIKFFGG